MFHPASTSIVSSDPRTLKWCIAPDSHGPSVQPNGEKHVVATYVINRKYEPVLAECNDFVNFRRARLSPLEACAGASKRGWWHKVRSSALDASRHWPGSRLSSRMAPIATRIKRSVGWPTAAVMRLTCLFFPSWITTSSHAVGTLRRTLIGTGRSHNSGSCLSRRTWAGLCESPSASRRGAIGSTLLPLERAQPGPNTPWVVCAADQ